MMHVRHPANDALPSEHPKPRIGLSPRLTPPSGERGHDEMTNVVLYCTVVQYKREYTHIHGLLLDVSYTCFRPSSCGVVLRKPRIIDMARQAWLLASIGTCCAARRLCTRPRERCWRCHACLSMLEKFSNWTAHV
jgi:hypothetical protein